MPVLSILVVREFEAIWAREKFLQSMKDELDLRRKASIL